jgi:carboxylesterase
MELKMNNFTPIYQHPELDGKSFYINGNKNKNKGLFFIHGFTATTVEVKQIALFFNKEGYTVVAPLLPGHGTTPFDMNKQTWSAWIKSVEESYQKLSMECSQVFVFGESMGALLALWLAYYHTEIKQIFLFAPALKVDGLWKSFFIWPFSSYVYKKNTDDSMLWQGYNVIPLRAATQFFRLQNKVKKLLHQVKNDAFIFQGKKDKTINLEGTVETYKLLGSKNKELIWLDNSSHCILLDKELPMVEAICMEKIKEAEE